MQFAFPEDTLFSSSPFTYGSKNPELLDAVASDELLN